VWAAIGALVTLILVVDPFDLHPADEWIHGLSQRSSAAHDHAPPNAEIYTCPMHPQIQEDRAGSCPICGMDLVSIDVDDGADVPETAAVDGRWTCPMHPTVSEDDPGTCPICGMDLVWEPADHDAHGNMDAAHATTDQGPVVRIDPVVVQNMNVTTETLQLRDLRRRIRTVGSLDYDQEGMVTVTTRYPGFIEKVYVDYIGQPVRRGDPLFEVYSPELVQTQRELLSAVSYAESLATAPDDVRRRGEELVTAARTRLEYWELTEDQIRTIERDGRVHRTVTVFAPSSGVVMKRTHGLQGMAIQPGLDVMHIANLSRLWLTVEVFEDQLQWVAVGMPAKIDITYLPGETITGRVRYMEPELEESSRTVRLTLEVPNRGGRLRVGMYASVLFEPVAVRDAVAVPSQAVLRTGERNIVVVALGHGRFAPREVALGVEGDDGYVQVVDGLTAGDNVVTSAQFLIDSESNLRSAVQKMTGTAEGTAAEHRH
jgi:Cu(I)/Ag(I) efflux system membrane fusion protein/cobalt-zinc-cadmium efflux system membrane fusion protein